MVEIKNSDIISDEEKSSILETLYLLSIPGMKYVLDEGVKLTVEDCCEDFTFSEEILADLISQGYTGEKLLSEFKKVTHQVRPAIEKIIEDADALAKASAEKYSDPTDAIFGTDELSYLAVFEPSDDGYGVYFPDLPGCISFGKNIEDAKKMARDALDIHIYEMEKDGDIIPPPSLSISNDAADGCIIAAITINPDPVKNKMIIELENEMDLKAIAEYEANPDKKTYSLDEIEMDIWKKV